MIHIQTFPFYLFPTNTYVVWDETNEAIIIDPACHSVLEQETIAKFLQDKCLTVKHILLTHFHFDHVIGVAFTEALTDLKCKAHAGDQWWTENNATVARTFGLTFPEKRPTIGEEIHDGEEFSFGHHTIHCIHTPGHSQGGMCFWCKDEEVAFVGDTLFASGSIGRTDLHGGNYEELMKSLREKLFHLPDTTRLYPGHGPATTLREERWHHDL